MNPEWATMDIEDWADEILKIFKTHLTEELNNIKEEKRARDEAEYGVQLNLDPVQTYDIGAGYVEVNYPALYVMMPEETSKTDEQRWKKQQYNFLIDTYIFGDDEAKLERRIVRYAKAEKRCLEKYLPTDRGSIERISYPPALEGTGNLEGMLIKKCRIAYRLLMPRAVGI